MKVTYHYDLDNEDANDKFNLNLAHHAFDMYSALDDLYQLKRNLEKGYVYYKTEEDEEKNIVDVDRLIDDLCEILSSSRFYKLQND